MELFLEIANAMWDKEDIPDAAFNHAFMVCIPKAATGMLQDKTQFHSPAGTRPLSIVVASNRILASIFKCTLEQEIGHRISNAQRGFLKDRKMLRNVLEIDAAAQKISFLSRSGAILLFDFAAAFPSLSHDMIWDTMVASGNDESFIDIVKMFYTDNRHILKLRGDEFHGVLVQSGVRQGCPLSGLLFAICSDVLLTRITKLFGKNEAIGAFADDIAVLLESFWVAAPSLQPFFQEFQQISALQLNVCKPVMMPPWSFISKDNVVKLEREFCPGWAKFEVVSCGKYLGYLIGPGAGAGVWSKALAKFNCRVTFWASLHLGVPFNVVAFNVIIVPVREFIAQLCDVDKGVSDAMDWAMRQLAAGPGTWATRRDLENLTSYGFKDEFRTIENTARAAKMRIIATVAKDEFNRSEEILLSQAESLNRPLRSWHASSFFGVPKRNRDELARVGITEERILRNVPRLGAPRSVTEVFNTLRDQ